MAGIRWGGVGSILLCACIGLAACTKQPQPGQVLDEAKQAGRDVASFPPPTEDYFHDMDRG